MKRTPIVTLALLAIAASTSAQAAGPDKKLQAKVDAFIANSFLTGENQFPERLKQDETMRACNQYRDRVPEKIAAEITAREAKNIQLPADGKMLGDWKKGEKHFKDGFAYRIGKIEPDDLKKDRGGNCYACHSGDPKEVAFGTIGPGLTGYGKLRGASDEIVKYTYEKIYNSQAFTACSQMPRLGYHGILTPEKVAHITAYLVSPDSPVNK